MTTVNTASRGNLLQRLHVPAAPQQLALLRILVALTILHTYSSGAIPLAMEVGFGPHAHLGSYIPVPGSTLMLRLLCGVVMLGALAVAVGWQSRVAAGITLVAYISTQSHYYRQLYFHDGWPYFVFGLTILALARSGDAWSVDAWLRARRGGERARPSLAYRWPLEAITLWFATLYVFAGLSKLMPLRKGWVWLDGEAIRFLILDRYLDSPVYWLLGRPLFDYDVKLLFALAAWSTVLVEVAPIVLVFTRRLHLPILLAVLGLHTVIYAFGVPGFLYSALALGVALLPERWFPSSAPARPRPGTREPASTAAGAPDAAPLLTPAATTES